MNGTRAMKARPHAVATVQAGQDRDTEAPGRGSERVMHPAQPLTMGPGPTGLAMVALVVAVTVRKLRRRASVP